MSQEIAIIRNYFDNAIRIGIKIYLRTNDGFQINDTDDGYKSDNFSEDLQQKVGISLKSSTCYNCGDEFELVFECKGELLEILNKHEMPTEFLALFKNKNQSQEMYLIKRNALDFKIKYPIKNSIFIPQTSITKAATELEKLFSYINLINHAY
jgi:hypothetical protein